MTGDDNRQLVLHVAGGFGVGGALGGAERSVASVVSGLERDPDYRPHLCVVRSADPCNERHGLTCPITFLGYAGADQDWIMAWKAARPLRTLIRTLRPALVHSHLWPATFTAGLAIRGLGTPHVIHVHDQRLWLESASWKAALRRRMHGWLIRANNPFFAMCSDATREYTISRLHCDPARTRAIHYGMDYGTFMSIPDPDAESASTRLVTVGLIARLTPEKGVFVLLEAFSRLAGTFPGLRLRILGSGNSRAAMERYVAEHGLGDRVSFLGLLPVTTGFLRDVDIVTLPTLSTEGLPLSILEAMAAGRPVVATAVAGITEAVQDGIQGLIVPPGDAAALAAALSRLITNSGERARMGRAARERAIRDFSQARMMKEITDLYREALS